MNVFDNEQGSIKLLVLFKWEAKRLQERKNLRFVVENLDFRKLVHNSTKTEPDGNTAAENPHTHLLPRLRSSALMLDCLLEQIQ